MVYSSGFRRWKSGRFPIGDLLPTTAILTTDNYLATVGVQLGGLCSNNVGCDGPYILLWVRASNTRTPWVHTSPKHARRALHWNCIHGLDSLLSMRIFFVAYRMFTLWVCLGLMHFPRTSQVSQMNWRVSLSWRGSWTLCAFGSYKFPSTVASIRNATHGSSFAFSRTCSYSLYLRVLTLSVNMQLVCHLS